MRANQVAALLMGGQACVLYGAAEFSRDADLAVLADNANLVRLTAALKELDARVIAVPPFDAEYLHRGHAVHFQCQAAEARGLRVDLMSRMRGVAPFPDLWAHRTTFRLDPALDVDVLALPDLVAAKKTQRDKDWPMIRRLVEVNYFDAPAAPSAKQIAFWLAELRSPALLIECAGRFAGAANDAAGRRPAVAAALTASAADVERELDAEQAAERERDRVYWAPLRAELESLRRER